mmetsp:Transcript_115524/g.230309  ORF Transcript_115524/g.230309 Transcript_115524/m.230309 type:complete len:242 (+) Transcript_115524:895-1620(+)
MVGIGKPRLCKLSSSLRARNASILPFVDKEASAKASVLKTAMRSSSSAAANSLVPGTRPASLAFCSARRFAAFSSMLCIASPWRIKYKVLTTTQSFSCPRSFSICMSENEAFRLQFLAFLLLNRTKGCDTDNECTGPEATPKSPESVLQLIECTKSAPIHSWFSASSAVSRLRALMSNSFRHMSLAPSGLSSHMSVVMSRGIDCADFASSIELTAKGMEPASMKYIVTPTAQMSAACRPRP